MAINVTGTESMIGGFVTAFPSGVARPLASNLNVDTWDQTIANHAIVRASNRGVSLFTQQGLHLIADLNGWYLGTADGGRSAAAGQSVVRSCIRPERQRVRRSGCRCR